jgi:hypothetical protein
MALLSPDEYAWRLFVALNWPARNGARDADQTKKLGDPGRVVWESWMLVSGGPANSRVYKTNGTSPDVWTAPLDTYCDASLRDTAPLQQFFGQQTAAHQRDNTSALFAPGVTKPGTGEVRMNQDTLDFITRNNLYYVEGQEALFASGTRNIAFKSNSKEIKAQWREISAAEEPRYHSCHYQGKIYGLTALHILTKDLPNWFWATFEHIDNNTSAKINLGTNAGYEEWILPSRDTFSCPSAPHDCNDFPKNIGLENTKWQYYRLRGTQIDFVDSSGSPTLLANSNIETGFQTTASCMSCHARSTIGQRINGSPRANRLNIFMPPFAADQSIGPVGSPNPDMYISQSGDVQSANPILKYTQLDFVWSLFRAQRRAP